MQCLCIITIIITMFMYYNIILAYSCIIKIIYYLIFMYNNNIIFNVHDDDNNIIFNVHDDDNNIILPCSYIIIIGELYYWKYI